MKALLVHAHTGVRKHVQIGFNWPVFLLLLVVLLPVALAVSFALTSMLEFPRALAAVPFAAAGVLSQSLARRANATRIRRLLASGWAFADPDSLEAGLARAEAGLPPRSTSQMKTPGAAQRPGFVLDEGKFVAACTEVPSPQPPLYIAMERAMKVPMTNPRTGEVKFIKVGWSWILFFFSPFFGLPLFLRKLYGWGAVFLIISLVLLLIQTGIGGQGEGAVAIVMLCWFAQLILSIFVAIKGNSITAKSMLEKGWTFAYPEAAETQYAKNKWRLIALPMP